MGLLVPAALAGMFAKAPWGRPRPGMPRDFLPSPTAASCATGPGHDPARPGVRRGDGATGSRSASTTTFTVIPFDRSRSW